MLFGQTWEVAIETYFATPKSVYFTKANLIHSINVLQYILAFLLHLSIHLRFNLF